MIQKPEPALCSRRIASSGDLLDMRKRIELRNHQAVRNTLPLVRPESITPEEDERVRNAFNLIKGWVDARPNHILVADTEGQFVKTTATSYYYLVGDVLNYKVDAFTEEPNRGHLIFIKDGELFYAYFPETEGFVEATDIVMGYEGALASIHGILSNEAVLFGASVSRCVVDIENGFELHLVFDAVQMGLNPPGEIAMIIRADSEGQIGEVEQQRLGVTQRTVMTYQVFETPEEVIAELPQTPDPAVTPPEGFYDEEAQKNILHFRLLEDEGVVEA